MGARGAWPSGSSERVLELLTRTTKEFSAGAATGPCISSMTLFPLAVGIVSMRVWVLVRGGVGVVVCILLCPLVSEDSALS